MQKPARTTGYTKNFMHSLYGSACPVGGLPAITAPMYTDDNEPVLIGMDILQKNGVTDDINYTRSKASGKIVARLYREKHGKEPRTEKDFVN